MTDGTDIRETWRRLDAWIDGNLPELRPAIHSGASDEELDRVEAEIGHVLPGSVRESFAVHDGQDDRGAVTGLVFGLTLLSLEDAMRQWRDWKSIEAQFDDDEDMNANSESVPEGAIQLKYALSGWFPLTHDFGGNHIGVDLDPGPNGTYGQIITFGRDEDLKRVIAGDWSSFLANVADELEAGNYEIGENHSLGMKDPPLHFHDALAELQRRRDG